MPDELLLGIDIGTSTIKANAVDRGGRSVFIGTAPTPFVATEQGVEMTAVALFEAVQVALTALGSRRALITAVGIASMGETGATLNAAGPSTAPMLAWHDQRGQKTVQRLIDTLGPEVRLRTGREARRVTTVAKLGWLADNGHDISGIWTGVAGLTLWKLTGAVAQEHSLAATSGAFDPRTREYDAEILKAAGVEMTGWAPAYKGGTPLGNVTPAGSAWSGLPEGIPVTIAGHDHPVGVVGAGGKADEVIDSMGTGEPLVVAWSASPGTDHPMLPDIDGDLTVSNWPGTDRLMLLWETLRPGMGLGYLADRFDVQRSVLEESVKDAPSDLVLDVAGLSALEHGILPSVLEGLSPSEAFTAALEGYAGAAARAEKAMRELTGLQGVTLLIGGGLRSERWVQAKRSRAVYPMWMAEEREAVSRGAALLAGVAAGWWAAEDYPAADLLELVAVSQELRVAE